MCTRICSSCASSGVGMRQSMYSSASTTSWPARETRERADPAKPPITIEGHTDSKGGDSYNQDLSVERAEAVRDHLAGRLGSGYTYEATGKVESEPIAKNEKPDGSDNLEGRARNRRVEISYQIKEEKPDVTVTTGPSDARGSTRPPAPLRAEPGPVAGSLAWRSGGDRLRVDFHPFRRDGAYLVATFDVVSEGDAALTAIAPSSRRRTSARSSSWTRRRRRAITR
ncbi:OmpA family protein [Nonomuraea deserti]|uniref:OmpA family protein n=1 Tax=Nonomuraea deserti TaxID=1848322 RepID=UPI001404451E|nr:OmpA family protein [Nonomuraea deserti]